MKMKLDEVVIFLPLAFLSALDQGIFTSIRFGIVIGSPIDC